MKQDQELTQAGFTQAGLRRYKETVDAYADTLHDKSVTYAEANRDPAPGTGLDVTAEHVRAAAHNIATGFGKEKPSQLSLPIQIAEYVCTALAGVGGGSMKEPWGTQLFGISIAIGIAFFVFRNTALNK